MLAYSFCLPTLEICVGGSDSGKGGIGHERRVD
jgi:hypothetical protein